MQESAYYTKKENGILITVKVVPGSSRSQIVGLHGNMLKIKVSAPPEKGKANKAVAEFLAESLGLKRTDVEIISGHTNSVKQVFLSGASVEAVEALYAIKNKH